jgi:hypothetical protein
VRTTAGSQRIGSVVMAVVAANVVRLLAITAVRLGDGRVPDCGQGSTLGFHDTYST